MKNSIYAKSIIFFLTLFFISNSLLIIVFIGSINTTVNITNEDYLYEAALTVEKLKNSGLSDNDIVDAISSDLLKVNFYDNLDDIKNDYKLIFFENQIRDINNGKKVLSEGYLVFMTGGQYCIISSSIASSPLTIKIAIVVAALIIVSVSVFIVFLGVGTIIKPLIDMSKAARKVAEGDYDIRLTESKNKDAIGQLIDDFNMMCKKLSETEMLRNDFISGISHEFKTPINSISGFAKIIKEETENPDHKDYLDRISEEAERLSTLSQNILTINRLDNIEDLADIEHYSFDEQIRQSILMLEKKWSEKNIELNIELDKVKISAKQDMMKQVIINLLDNAIKFTPYNGKIEITLTKEKNKATLFIHDSGKGIKKEEIDRIFEKFYKGDPSRNTMGNGLGLSIVKKILDLHGFSITVRNSEEGGAEFVVIIPEKN